MQRLFGVVLLTAAAMMIAAGLAAKARTAEAPAKPAGPLVASLLVQKDTYTLDPAQSGQAFRDKLAEFKKKGGPAPATPRVDLVLQLTNVSDRNVTIRIGGDESRIDLKLEGPGAVTIPNLVPMTMEFRMGADVTIAPSKTHNIKITSLSFGQRGIAQCAYWTEPGDYTLSATLVAAQGEGQIAVASEAVKLKVVKPGQK